MLMNDIVARPVEVQSAGGCVARKCGLYGHQFRLQDSHVKPFFAVLNRRTKRREFRLASAN